MSNVRPRRMDPRILDISCRGLLHDARLLTVDWVPELAQVALVFDCLRCDLDGSELADRCVEIRLTGVQRIAAYYNPATIGIRPSRFHLDRPFNTADLKDWPFPPGEALLSVNSIECSFGMRTSWRIDWLKGGPSLDDRSPLFVDLQLDQHDHSDTACDKSLYFECGKIVPLSSGRPLGLDEWKAQYDAWWKRWEEHWQEDGDEEDDHETIEEDTFIPAGHDPPPDLSYRPPKKPAFLVRQTDAPASLLDPIRTVHEAILAKDWARLAGAWPNLDKSNEDRVKELSEQYLSYDFGRWIYVRWVYEWWEEGRQACVTLGGIEHWAPDDETPARNEEVVISYGLRKHDGRWRIWTYCEGIAQHDSADHGLEDKPWLDGWAIGHE